MEWLLSFYIGTTIFGVGVTLIDVFGSFGDDGGDHDGGDAGGDDAGGDDAGGDHDGGDAGGDDAGGDDAGGDDAGGDHDGVDHDSDEAGDDHDSDEAGDDHDSDEASEHDQSEDENSDPGSDLKQTDHHQSIVVFNHSQRRGFILKALSMTRSLVYFSLGFGPVGCFAFLAGTKGWLSLAFSVPFGLVALLGSRFLKRIQKQVLDSQIKEADLIMEQAEVLVSIKPGKIGKIRIQFGHSYADRYAKAKNFSDDFKAGMKVRIVDIAEDLLIVDKE